MEPDCRDARSVSHGYDAVDYATLADAVREDVPALLDTVEQMIGDIERERERGRAS